MSRSTTGPGLSSEGADGAYALPMLLIGSRKCILGVPIKQRCYKVIAVRKP